MIISAVLLAAVIGVAVVFNKKCGELKSKNTALISVIEASQQLGTSNSLESVISIVSKCTKTLVAIDTMAVYLIDEDNVEESSMIVKGVESAHGEAFVNFNPDKVPSCLGKALRSRVSVKYGDFNKEAGDEEKLIPRNLDFHSAMVAPLLFEGRAIGAVFVSNHQPNLYNGDTQHFFDLLCSQVALAIRNAQLQEGLSALAIRDSMSGLFTHGYFQEHLGKCLVKAKYAKQPVSLLILDVDYFKKVNDNYGHPQGDALLKQLGGVIRSVVRPSDVICRYGGDEFTVTMLDTSQIQATVLADKIRQAVEEYEFVLGSQIVHITVSGGVADFPEGCSSKKDLIKKADDAMYQAKKSGRNKIKF